MFKSLRKIASNIYRYFRAVILKDNFYIEVRRWFKDQGDIKLRLNYPNLNKNSIVFDVGGYLGDFAEAIQKKYGCLVYLFEPHPKFFNKCKKRFKDNKKIISLNYGLSNQDKFFNIYDDNDGSSFYRKNHDQKNQINCEVRDILKVKKDLKINQIDLIKINIEGEEYNLLEHLIQQNSLDIAFEYQIQFHNFLSDAKSRRNFICKSLSKSHYRTWCYEFVWENWTLKRDNV